MTASPWAASPWGRGSAGTNASLRALRPASDLRLVLASLVAVALVVSSLLLVVFVRVGQTQAGYRVHDLRTELVRLQQERAALDVERATLLRPARLAQLARSSLGLAPVDAERVIAVRSMSAGGKP